MPADASIYAMMRPPQPGPGPLELAAQGMQIRHMMDQGQLNEMQRQQLQRSMDEDAAVKAAFSGMQPGQTIGDILPQVMKASPKTGVSLQKSYLEQQKAEADLKKTNLESHALEMKQLRDKLASVTTDQQLQQFVQEANRLSGGKGGYDGPASVSDPNFAAWRQQSLLTADQMIERMKPHQQAVSAGGQTVIREMNPNAPGFNPAPIEHTPTPEGLENARHHDVTERQAATAATETARHHAAIEGDPTTIEQTAQAIAKGELAPLSGFALARPMGQQIMARVVAINPEFNPTAFATRQRVENAFANGKEAQAVRSFSVGISHLGTLENLADALHNGNMQLVNKLGNAIGTATGNPAVTNFEGAKKIVGDEIVKAIVGSGGGVADREEAAKTIAAASSPAQLKGVIATYKELMKGQLDGLRRQYQAGGGRKDFDKDFLSEEARAVAKGAQKEPAPAGKRPPLSSIFGSGR